MLLYIGEQREACYLQELSDQLQQPICVVAAPEDPTALVSMVKSQYSHYMISLSSYNCKPKELVLGLKRFIEVADGKLMLLAVDMTTETPVINELLYAGFTNIYFVNTAEPYAKVRTTEVMPVTSMATAPLSSSSASTAPMEESDSFIQESTIPMSVDGTSMEHMGPVTQSEGALSKETSKKKKRVAPVLIVFGCIVGTLIITVAVLSCIYLVRSSRIIHGTGQQLMKGEGQGSIDIETTVPSTTPTPSQSVKNDTTSSPTSTPELPFTDTPVQELTTAPPTVVASPSPSPEAEVSVPPLVVVEGSKSTSEDELGAGGLTTTPMTPKPSSAPKCSLSLPESVRMVTGGRINLDLEISPANVTGLTYSWKSSDIKVATVKDGEVTAKKAGVVTIIVMASNGIKDACKITIGDQ